MDLHSSSPRRDSLTLIGERPWFGSGPETFAAEFRRIESAELARAYPDHFHEAPHNVFLDAAAAQGVFGLLSLLIVLGAGMGARSHDDLERGLWAGIAATCVWSLFANLTVATGLMLYAGVGILVGVRSSGGSFGNPGLPLPRSLDWLLRSTAAALVVAGLLYTIHDRKFQNAKDFINRREVASAQGEYASLIALPFPQPGFDLWYSRSMATLSMSLDTGGSSAALKSAVQSALRSESTSEERFNALYQSAALALALGDSSTGEAKLRQAILESPTWYKPRILLARLLRETGRETEARREARSAVELAGARAAQIEKF